MLASISDAVAGWPSRSWLHVARSDVWLGSAQEAGPELAATTAAIFFSCHNFVGLLAQLLLISTVHSIDTLITCIRGEHGHGILGEWGIKIFCHEGKQLKPAKPVKPRRATWP